MKRRQEKKVVPELRNPVCSRSLCWFLTQLAQSCCLGMAHLSVMPAGDGCCQGQRLHCSLNTHSKLSLASSPPARRLNRQKRWKKKKGKKIKTGAGEKYYIPYWIAWNFFNPCLEKLDVIYPSSPAMPPAPTVGNEGSQGLATGAVCDPAQSRHWSRTSPELGGALHQTWGKGSGTDPCKNLHLSS